MWFKILLCVYLGLTALLNLIETRKGTYQIERTAFINALSSLICALLALGVWYLL